MATREVVAPIAPALAHLLPSLPESWTEAKDAGADRFVSDEACPTCGAFVFFTDTLACFGCTHPKAPLFSDVAPDRERAIQGGPGQAGGFTRYASTPCEAEVGNRSCGSTERFTDTQRCTSCHYRETERLQAEERDARAKREEEERLAARKR